MNWKGFGSGSDLMKVLSWHLLGGTEENYEKVNQYSRSLE
jgi:hypothetical protein